jgi:hypothetical protein
MKTDVMGEVCDIYGAEHKCIEGCREKKLREVADWKI